VVERHTVARFTPIGKPRELAVTMLRRGIDAIAENDSAVAAELFDQVPLESADDFTATARDSCIGVAVNLLDGWLSGHAPDAPNCLAARVRPPSGHWSANRAAADILTLAGMGRAFRSLDTLLTHYGGPQVLSGSALALAATTQAWGQATGTPTHELARIIVR
jgi:pantothenate kinase-related protein Tda10